MSFGHWLAAFTKRVPARSRSRRPSGKHRRPASPATVVSENLESRILLAAAAVTGMRLDIVDSGSEANDITLSVSGADLIVNDSANALSAGAGTTQVDANTISVPLASVDTAAFSLGANDDSLTVDFQTGSPTLTGGIIYDGGDGRDVQIVNFSDDGGETDMVTVTDGGGGRIDVARTASGTLGAFSLSLGTVETVVLNLLDGNDTVDGSASPIGLTINGGDGADSVTGSGFVDRINGDAGNDTLAGLDGADVISGGVGSDTIRGDDSASGTGGADTIVGGVANPMVTFRTNFGDIPIELFADQAPNTVASFLDYVDDDDYINSFIHRSIPGFVIQGGGFTTSQETFVQGTTVVSAVPTNPPILNEGNGVGNRSNVRGTISTAQQGGNINTFTSQWFVNLADNLNLDAVPHVVFGNVLDMTVPDLIAALTTFNITAETGNGALTDTPLDDTPASGNGKLVVVSSVIYSIVPSSTSVDVDGDDVIFGAGGADTLFGSGGNDMLMGDADADLLDGGDGNDTVNGNAGIDTLFGSAGNDTLMGGSEADSMIGGDGDDVVNGNAGNDTAFGNAGDDTLMGGSEADSLVGGDGSDMVRGQGASDDTVSGGAGDDTLDGGPGPSTLVESADGDFTLVSGLVAGEGTLTGSETGMDVLIEIEQAQLTGGDSANVIDTSGFTGPVTLDGGAGGDVLTGGDGGATITGGSGTDSITGGTGADDLRGGDDNDTLSGGDGEDTLFGDAGDDLINGGSNDDTLNGSAGSDTLNGDDGADVLNGNGGSGDILTGGLGNDTLDGGDGEDSVDEERDSDFVLTDTSLTIDGSETDTLSNIEGGILIGGAGNNSIDASAFTGTSNLAGAGGDDVISGSAQNSSLDGGSGNDSITGGAGNDNIAGSTGNDTLAGSAGNDTLSGGSDDDLINGGLGADRIIGGDGDDRLIGESNADITSAVTTLAALNTDNSDSIDGGLGNDTIVGGVGADAVNGGDGLDIIDVASGGDTSGGVDTVTTSVGGDLVFADPEDVIVTPTP